MSVALDFNAIPRPEPAPRRSWSAQCGQKTEYASQLLADNAALAKYWMGVHSEVLESYLCPHCDCWHLGHGRG